MRSTKILVFRLKQIVYTALFVALGVILIILLIFMLTKNKNESTPTFEYIPGVYTSSFLLDNQPVGIELVVDSNHINSISLIDVSDSTKSLYPILETAMENIENQMLLDGAIETLQIQTEYKHTSALLLDAINEALAKAQK